VSLARWRTIAHLDDHGSLARRRTIAHLILMVMGHRQGGERGRGGNMVFFQMIFAIICGYKTIEKMK